MFNDKCRVEALRFEKTSNELVDKSVGGSWWAAIDFVFFALVIEELSSFLSGEVFG
jgi:hypothetical protein